MFVAKLTWFGIGVVAVVLLGFVGIAIWGGGAAFIKIAEWCAPRADRLHDRSRTMVTFHKSDHNESGKFRKGNKAGAKSTKKDPKAESAA